jgi:hypothetical protein
MIRQYEPTRIDTPDKNEKNRVMDGFAPKGFLPLKATLGLAARKTTVRCRIAAAACLRGSAETIAQARRQPVIIGAQKMPASFLKHAEDQTVLALMTVLSAFERENWQTKSFADWGVIAAPNFFGRVSTTQTFERYRQEGAWGVSPHSIPHQSLHAISGTLSQALKTYGPNFGIGGGANSSLDAFLIAGAMMMDGSLPGLWLVLTGYESEWIPPAPAPTCQAIALALMPTQIGDKGIHISLGQVDDGADLDPHWPDLHLNLLAEEWTLRGAIPEGHWRLSETHWLELGADGEGRP